MNVTLQSLLIAVVGIGAGIMIATLPATPDFSKGSRRLEGAVVALVVCALALYVYIRR